MRWLMGYLRRSLSMGGSDKFVGHSMDALIGDAGRALAAGDPLGALKLVALRKEPPALALRGIAMAQLGDFVKAKALLRDASRGFGAKHPLARARCLVAQAEVALASRDLAFPAKTLDAARTLLEKHGDKANAAHARYLEVRRLLLIGRLDDAERALTKIPTELPASLRTAHELVIAGIAIRRIRTREARAALMRAERAAQEAGIPALWAEVDSALRVLNTMAARRIANGSDTPLKLEGVEALLASRALVVDACRLCVRRDRIIIDLRKRPVLFKLVRALAEAWPSDVSRDALVARAFRLKLADESHRARLRVEIGRLRRVLRALGDVTATKEGFALKTRAREVVVLALPVEEEYAQVLALLSDGEAWSSSALATALASSQRTVQRALDELALAGKVQSFGRGRARRWLTPPLPGFTTTLLLPAALSLD
jgi:DNA-binding winged helix-turn-helix (wHTH) protein